MACIFLCVLNLNEAYGICLVQNGLKISSGTREKGVNDKSTGRAILFRKQFRQQWFMCSSNSMKLAKCISLGQN